MFSNCFFAALAASGRALVITALILLTTSGPAGAESAQIKTAPASTRPHGSLRVTISDVTLLDLTEDIRTVVIANPEVLDATVVTPRRLMLLGKKPGSTTLLVSNADGAAVLKSVVMVVPSELGMVTVDRGLKETNLSCAPRCVAVEATKDSGAPGSSPPASPPPPPATAPTGGTPASAGGPPLPPPSVQVNQ